MKKIFILAITVFFIYNMEAQTSSKKATSIREEMKTMSLGVKNSIIIEIPNIKPGDVEDRWKKLLDSYNSKPKWNRKEKEFFSDNAQITEINGNNPIDIYSRVEESGTNNTLLTVWFDLGGAFLSSEAHSDKYGFGEKIVSQFGKDCAIYAATKVVEDEEKSLKKMEKKLKDLVDDKEDLKKDIENYKAKIKKAEEDIIKNDGNQKEQAKNIETQKEALKKAQQRLEETSKA